jgi:hypothetical protein
MKTFRTFNIKDTAFYCKRGSINYKSGSVKEIKHNELIFSFDGAGSNYATVVGDSLDKTIAIHEHRNYKEYDVIIFSLESEAIRYCKTNLLKELRDKIDKAKKFIQDVIDFRLENIEHLNNQWIECEIFKLQKQEKEVL